MPGKSGIPEIKPYPFPGAKLTPYQAFKIGWYIGDALADYWFNQVETVPGTTFPVHSSWSVTKQCSNCTAPTRMFRGSAASVCNNTLDGNDPREVTTVISGNTVTETAWTAGCQWTFNGPRFKTHEALYRQYSLLDTGGELLPLWEPVTGVVPRAVPGGFAEPVPDPALSEAGNSVDVVSESTPETTQYIVAKSGVATSSTPHRRKPPEPGTKEKKSQGAAAAAKAIQTALGALTEAQDIIDAVYKAIPKKYRLHWNPERPITMEEKLQHIFNNLDKVNITDAMSNIVKNAIEDAVAGKAESLNRNRHPDGVDRQGLVTPYGEKGSPSESAGALVNELFKALGV